MSPMYPRLRTPIDIRILAVRSLRDCAVHVAYLRYSFCIGKAVSSNALNVILPRRKTKRETIKGSYGIIFIWGSLNVSNLVVHVPY